MFFNTYSLLWQNPGPLSFKFIPSSPVIQFLILLLLLLVTFVIASQPTILFFFFYPKILPPSLNIELTP
jgi:hypothetical protein